jgi:hypothetical protein
VSVQVQSSVRDARPSDKLQIVPDLAGRDFVLTLHGMGDSASASFTADDLRELRRQVTEMLWRNI